MPFLYYQPRYKKEINVTKIITIIYNEMDNGFDYSGESHDFWELVYVDAGSFEVRRNDEKLILRQGDFIIHEPNEFHAIKAHKGSCFDFFVISFECKSPAMKVLRKYNGKLDESLRPFITSIIREAQDTYYLEDVYGRIEITAKDKIPFGGKQMVKSYLEQFLISLIRNISSDREVVMISSKEGMENRLVAEIKKYIEANVTERVNAELICTQFGYSRAYLSRLFKDQCGCSMMKYSMQKKIDHAKKLIREKKYTIGQISDMLCFDNPQYFSRVFKRITNRTPSEYAKVLRR